MTFISIISAVTLLSFLFLLNPLNSYAALQDKDYTMNYLEGDSLYNYLQNFEVSVSYRTNTTEVFTLEPEDYTVLYRQFDDPAFNNDVYPPSTCVAIGINNDFRNYLDVIDWTFKFTPKFDADIFGFLIDSYVTYALWNESGFTQDFFDISSASMTYTYTDGVTYFTKYYQNALNNTQYHTYPVPYYSYSGTFVGAFGQLSGFKSGQTMHLLSLGVGIHELELLDPEYILPYTFTGFTQTVNYSGSYSSDPDLLTYDAFNICYLLDIRLMSFAIPSSEYNEAIALYRILVDLNLPLPSKDEILSGQVDFIDLIGGDINEYTNASNKALEDGYGGRTLEDINDDYFDVITPRLSSGLGQITIGMTPLYENSYFSLVLSGGFIIAVSGYVLFGKRG